MTFFLPNAPGGAAGFATSDQDELAPPTPAVVAVEQAPRATQSYRFNQRFFPLDDGRTLLRLHEPLTLTLDQRTMDVEVENWGIRMHCGQVEDLPRQIARRFLMLFSKADNDLLTEAEKLQWLNICDHVDVSQFSVDRSAPHYTEGTLKKKLPLTVEWHDGTTESLPVRLAGNFHPLEPGESFSAFVKIGKDGQTLSIERVSLLQA